MGRMKEFCIDLINANEGIPEGMTIADVARMKELEMYNWEEYERRQKQIELQYYKLQNPGEAAKIEQSEKKYSPNYGEAKDKKSEQ
jgi:hypothetical protein